MSSTLKTADLSIVIPLYNESLAFSQLRGRLDEFVRKVAPTYRAEILLIDDGSIDDTWDQIVHFAATHPFVKGIQLSRNFGHQMALFAGYKASTGNVIVSMDGDLQDPPEVVAEMLSRFQDGCDIVYAIRGRRHGETLFKRLTASAFYRFLAWVGNTRAPLDCGDFRLLSRRALDALLEMNDKQKYLRGMVGWIGFRSTSVEYERPARAAGETKFNLTKMARFALDGIISFSRFPLRLAFILSALSTIPFLIYLSYSLLLSIFAIKPLAPGWTSLLLCVVVFGSVNLFCLGILGEYVGRIFENTKQRPDFLVMNTTPEHSATGIRTHALTPSNDEHAGV